MGQRRAIRGLVALVVALLTIGAVVAQDATGQETPARRASLQHRRHRLFYLIILRKGLLFWEVPTLGNPILPQQSVSLIQKN